MDFKDLTQLVKTGGIKLTPMMKQYFSIKENYLDHMLMFRMGDFYEVFFDDAKSASKILNIALTHRGKVGEHPIPMAGIPHHAASNYIDKFSKSGLKVAICEQIEDPKDAIGIVKRAVTQVVSPAIPYDLDKTDANDNQFIVTAQKNDDDYSVVALDFTTGEFLGYQVKSFEDFIEKIRTLNPKEFITHLGQWDANAEVEILLKHLGTLVTHLSSEYFETSFTEIHIEKLIPTFKRDQVLNENSDILAPIGALSYYVSSTQSYDEFTHIQPFSLISETGLMKVTTPTLTGLEILPKSRETYNDSLLGFMDKTKTAHGSRYLRSVFSTPLTDKKIILSRQETIKYFIENDDQLKDTRDLLGDVRDLERILAKVSTGKANAGDLLNVASAVDIYEQLRESLKSIPMKEIKNLTAKSLKSLIILKLNIRKTLNDEIGATLDKGNLIKEGANKLRDKLASLSINAATEVLQLEAKYREETGIPKLRIKSNNVAGYFIEVSKSYSSKVPETFTRRQTLVNAERFSTPELTDFEKEVVSAKGKLEKLEREIFKTLIQDVTTVNNEIRALAKIISNLDVLQSFSWVARNEDFSCPSFSTKIKEVNIKGAWHPLIKSIIKDKFVSHDLLLNEKKFFGLITGPNMAGKTTVMREIAIIQHLTQIGSFVPAKSATVSICDYLFSRLGASDDILKGQSTFMVEMAETAEIIRHATQNSLIILDEVGRGTSTYDGLSIAWALVEHFIEKTQAICLFATHYHELISLVEKYDGAKNLTVETINNNGNVQFLYRLIEEAASQSFGIYVAKLAGIPKDILARSENILKTLEKENKGVKIPDKSSQQLDIFDIQTVVEVPDYLLKIEDNISDLDLNNLTPLQALNKLQELKNQVSMQ